MITQHLNNNTFGTLVNYPSIHPVKNLVKVLENLDTLSRKEILLGFKLILKQVLT